MSSQRNYAELLLPLLDSERIVGHILANSNKNSLDPAIPALFEHCVFWGERIGGPFTLVHDDSKPIFQEKETLEDFFSRGEEEQTIGYGRRQFVFPLRVKDGIKFARSEEDPRLQVADLVAGASAYWASGLISPRSRRGEFFDDIVKQGLDRFVLGGVFPYMKFDPELIRAEYKGGTNAIDHITEFLATHRKKT
jgi:hypothetical protein